MKFKVRGCIYLRNNFGKFVVYFVMVSNIISILPAGGPGASGPVK